MVAPTTDRTQVRAALADQREDEREWAKVIRSWLLVTGGAPPQSRQITDHVGGPRKAISLRLGGAPT